ncbi:alanine:cation symporter family protein [Anaerotruncus sp. 80]|uniref:Alanine:cation symporter family protein n=2 Tax=Bacillota TaxID=1239 RepID=A0A845QJD7_9FIRM|nr:alanine:cation symporter family protein [Emergencia sp.]NBH60873.1 alanine:cation symporter family protein [Anaerotruncus colihominis]NCE99068.1 alanine:cation symporter family protein [Emergencia sp. 1XD21-10]NCF01528.1 alanine:cation symporter family protein [Anaerotruncus sp. 80]
MGSLVTISDAIDGWMYSNLLFWALIVAGLFFTIRTKFVQIRLFPEGIRVLMEKSHDGGISSFQALMIATASRVGTGNIAGIATAIVAGGPGAVFWMWIMAIVGAASAFIESTLAQIYKQKDGEIFKGGPAYYIERAMKARWLGVIFAILLILTFAFGFNGLQAYNIASSLEHYAGDNYAAAALIVGVILAGVSAILFFGGAQKISTVSSVLVPIMASVYILIGIIITLSHVKDLPAIFSMIFEEAFDFEAIFGGFAGSCMVWGVKRGLFSNEAGMGSAPNAAAAADVSHPVKQGLVQVISVFIDTLIICTTTVFIVLCTGKYTVGGELNGIPLVQESVKSMFGEIGVGIITVSVALFAFTSLIGNYFYAEANIKFISESKAFMTIFRLLAVVMVFIGANSNLQLAWNLADIIMGGMAIVNIIAMFCLGGIAIRALNNYVKQREEGINPVFKAKDIGLDNTDLWK